MKSSLAGVAALMALLLCTPALAAADRSGADGRFEATAPKPVDLLGSEGQAPFTAAQDGEGEPIFDDPEEQRAWEQSFQQATSDEEEDRLGLDRGSSLSQRLAQTVTALLIVLALIVLCYWGMRRFGGRTPLLAGSTLGAVLGQIHLNSKVSLHFVRVKDRVVVVGVTSSAIAPVAEFDAALFREEPARLAPLVQEKGAKFLAQLKDSAQRLQGAQDGTGAAAPRATQAAGQAATDSTKPGRTQGSGAASDQAVDEIAELREGIRRLQAELQEASRELEQ